MLELEEEELGGRGEGTAEVLAYYRVVGVVGFLPVSQFLSTIS